MTNKRVNISTSKGKLVWYQEQSGLAFQLSIKSQLLSTPIDLFVLMTYCLTLVPASLGTPDVFFNKTNKATAMHYLLTDRKLEVQCPDEATFIQDGNALFHGLTSLPQTFGDIYLLILDQMTAKKNFVVPTVSYHPLSIKCTKRLRRGCSERLLVKGCATRIPCRG